MALEKLAGDVETVLRTYQRKATAEEADCIFQGYRGVKPRNFKISQKLSLETWTDLQDRENACIADAAISFPSAPVRAKYLLDCFVDNGREKGDFIKSLFDYGARVDLSTDNLTVVAIGGLEDAI